MFSKGGVFSTFFLFAFIIFLGFFFLYPVNYTQVVNKTIEVPYETWGEITDKIPVYTNSTYEEKTCANAKPDVNIRAVPDGEWKDDEPIVRYKCLIFNKEDQIINVTYKLTLGKNIPFLKSIPVGYESNIINTKIFQNQAYSSRPMFFDRSYDTTYKPDCVVVDSETIYKCVSITKTKTVVGYREEKRNGTITLYNTITALVEENRTGTLFRVADGWLKSTIPNIYAG